MKPYLRSYKSGESEIISYLLDEGYADSPDSAYVIMENMSEVWKEDVKKTLKKIGKKVSNTTPVKKLKRFAKYTTLGIIGGALLS